MPERANDTNANANSSVNPRYKDQPKPEWIPVELVVKQICSVASDNRVTFIAENTVTNECAFSMGQFFLAPAEGDVIHGSILKKRSKKEREYWQFSPSRSAMKPRGAVREEQVIWRLREIPGIGPGHAQKAFDLWGLKAFETILKDPERLTEIIGPSYGKWREKAEAALKNPRRSPLADECVNRLMGYGFTFPRACSMLKKVKHRERGIQRLLRDDDPYRLMEVPGLGIATIDNALQSTGKFSVDHPVRVMGVLSCIMGLSAEIGSTFVPNSRLASFLNGVEVEPKPELRTLYEKEADFVRTKRGYFVLSNFTITDECRFINIAKRGLDVVGIAAKKPVLFEQAIALWCYRVLHQNREGGPTDAKIENIPADILDKLVSEQRRALQTALDNRLSVLTGLPGTGKTFTVTAMTYAFGRDRSVVLAPTGKAAKRAQEVTGLPREQCYTVHRYTNEMRKLRGSDEHKEGPALFIIDEVSMLDVEIAAKLFSMLPRNGYHVVFVGDKDQLPSVGQGQILSDCILSPHIPTTSLVRIHRQAANSKIVTNALKMITGEPMDITNTDPDHGDWFCREFEPTPEGAKEISLDIPKAIKRAVARWGLDPLEDIQVLCLMRTGQTGVENMNRILREMFNPQPQGAKGQPLKTAEQKPELWSVNKKRNVMFYRLGDKVVCSKNDPKLGVVNGDMGTVTEMDMEKNTATVAVIGLGNVKLSKSNRYLFSAAYAMTVHKAQGSEFPFVILPIANEHHHFLDARMIYTAMTRAKQRLMVYTTRDNKVLGKRAAWKIALGNLGLTRDTCLYFLLNKIFNIKGTGAIHNEQTMENNLSSTFGGDET